MDGSRRQARERAHLSTLSTDECLRRLLERLTPELRGLLEHGENFRVTINASAGRTFHIEVVKNVHLN